jgi:hypothetical protein
MLYTFQANLLLSDLNPSVRRVAVLARVARTWDFHKDNDLMHLDVVFVDEKAHCTFLALLISN